jgi:Leucine-rich repeat (LRR) protein
VDAGTDVDRSGTLEASEVQSTSYVCNGGASSPCDVIEGDVLVRNTVDLRGLAGCTEILGNVTVTSSRLTGLQGLEALQHIGGNLVIDDCPSLSSIAELSSLEAIDGNLELSNLPALTSLTGLESLGTVGGNLVVLVTGLAALSALSSLTAIGGDVQVGLSPVSSLAPLTSLALTRDIFLVNLPNLAGAVEFGAVVTARSLPFFDLPLVTEVSFPSLLSVTSFDAATLPSLTSLNFPNAEFVSAASLPRRRLLVRDNAALTTLSGFRPPTELDQLELSDNPALDDVAVLASLTAVTDEFRVVNDPQLPTCEAQAIFDGLSVPPNTAQLAGTDDTATCP